MEVCQQLKEWVLQIGHVSYGRHSDHQFNFIIVLWFLGCHYEEGRRSLRVTYVEKLRLAGSA